MVTFDEPADALKLSESGDTENVQGGCAFCVMVTGWPAMVTVPVRAPPVLAAVPDPDVPAVTVIQEAPDVVVHPHPVVVVTPTFDELAVAANVIALVDKV